VSAVANWLCAGLPAHAEPNLFRFFGLVFHRFKICALVTSIAKGLGLAATAGTPPIRFASFHVDTLWAAPGAHDFVRVFDVRLSRHDANLTAAATLESRKDIQSAENRRQQASRRVVCGGTRQQQQAATPGTVVVATTLRRRQQQLLLLLLLLGN
jgi:hypothetical protein